MTSTIPSSTTHSDHHTDGIGVGRRISTETKHSLKTTELAVYVLAVLGVLVASAVVDNADFGPQDNADFGPQEAWKYVSWLTIGYLVSRGLAKSGSRDFYDDDSAAHSHR